MRNLRESLALHPDTRVILEDGEVVSNANILRNSCTHFADLLTSEFSEGKCESPKQDTITDSAPEAVLNTMEEPAALCGYDSDFDGAGAAVLARRQGLPKLREIKLPEFS